MNLRSANVYRASAPARPAFDYAPLERDLDVDVAVVGAGVSGALAAVALVEKGLSVAVLDRRPPGQGSTFACTAMLQYELDVTLVDLAAKYGQAKATEAYRVSRQALEWVEELVDGLDDDCDLAARPTLYLARDDGDLPAMRAECAARRAVGLDCRWAEGDELNNAWGVPRPGAIYSSKSLELEPCRLTHALLRRAAAGGAKLYCPAEVADYGWGTPTVKLKTKTGPTVTAKHAVVSTGYETPAELRQHVGRMVTTFAAVSRPTDVAGRWPERQLMWEWGDNYLYARTLPGDRVIFGGGDEPLLAEADRDALVAQKAAGLAARVRGLLPGLDLEVDQSWAGTFATTADGLPYIGPAARYPGALFALGYGGNGITFSLIASRVLAGLVTGDRALSAPAGLFAFER